MTFATGTSEMIANQRETPMLCRRNTVAIKIPTMARRFITLVAVLSAPVRPTENPEKAENERDQKILDSIDARERGNGSCVFHESCEPPVKLGGFYTMLSICLSAARKVFLERS